MKPWTAFWPPSWPRSRREMTIPRHHRDIAVFHDPGHSDSSYADALLAIERAQDKHVRDAHGGDQFAPDTATCDRCRTLDEAEERLLQDWSGAR